MVTSVIRQKPQKPLALDAKCFLRAIDVVPARKSLKQAWIFSVSPTITQQGSCIHRKAINKEKPLSSGFLFYHGLDGFSGFACGGNRSKSLLLSLGLRPFSQAVMFIHASKLACLNLPTRLVCP